MSRGDTGSGGADIKRLGQFHEFGARNVGSPQKNRDLEANTRRAAGWGVVQALAFLHIELSLQILSRSTTELVRTSALTMPDTEPRIACKSSIRLPLTKQGKRSVSRWASEVWRCLVRFPKCANQAPLPLTLSKPFASIEARTMEKHYHSGDKAGEAK